MTHREQLIAFLDSAGIEWEPEVEGSHNIIVRGGHGFSAFDFYPDGTLYFVGGYEG